MKKPTAPTIAILLVLSVSALSQAAEKSLADLQREAVGLYQAGRYEAAIPLYQRVVDAEPKNKGALKDLLLASWLGENYEVAADVGARLVHLSPNDVEAHFMYARSLLAIGQKEEALTAFEECRKLDPNEEHIQLAAARVEGMLRDYDASLTHLEALKKAHPDYKDVYAELARVQQVTEAYGPAAENWGKAVGFFPDNHVYAFHQAECLYFSGQEDAALQQLRLLSADRPAFLPAIDFLTDALLAKGDPRGARALLESQLLSAKPGDESHFLKLIHLDQQERRWSDILTTADQWLALDPLSGAALLSKADAFRNLGQYKKAADIYEYILRANPGHISALRYLAQTQNAAGHPQEALQTIQRAVALDPTDPYLLIFQSYYLYEAGDRAHSKALLEQWIAGHSEPALPVLLYHGVTPYDQSPILAYPVLHRTTTMMDDHFKSLHEAGYTAVTTQQVSAWMSGKGTLPERPILITFDDARMDSLKYADPLLKQYGLKATMFAPLADVEGYISKYASWKELDAYHRTGRWEIESHGDRAHDRVPTDDVGHRGLFLLNKAWLKDARRLETESEWTARARDDYEKSQRKIGNRLGEVPKAYAFPEGNYGQDDISNATDSAALNLAWAAKTYESAYHEDDYGFNVRSRDPMLLTRYEPEPGQTGASLLKHLTDQTPAVLMLRRLLREAAWERRLHEAGQWMEELRKRGVSSSSLSAEEARIHYADGDWKGARTLAAQALREDHSAENTSLVEEIENATQLFWRGRFAYQEDNNHRISRRFRQQLGFWHPYGFDLSLHHLFGSYSERGIDTVTENGGGIEIAHPLGEFHRISLEATGHALTAGAKTTYSLIGALHSGWTEAISTDLEGGRTIYDTARALNANVINHFISGVASWQPEKDWRASAKTRLEDLSDNNNRVTSVLEGGRRLFLPQLWLVGRATLDTTKNISSNYYSPQLLQEYQLGFDYTLALPRSASLNVAYMPGYGKEKTSEGEFVNDIDASLSLPITSSLTLVPAVSLIRQPSYHRNTYSAQLSYRF